MKTTAKEQALAMKHIYLARAEELMAAVTLDIQRRDAGLNFPILRDAIIGAAAAAFARYDDVRSRGTAAPKTLAEKLVVADDSGFFSTIVEHDGEWFHVTAYKFRVSRVQFFDEPPDRPDDPGL